MKTISKVLLVACVSFVCSSVLVHAQVAAIDACGLLTASEPASLLGEPISEMRPLTQIHNDNMSISHCMAVTGDEETSITLRVRSVPGRGNPTSREEYASTVGKGIEEEISAGELLSDLGQLSFWYEYGGLTLVVLWNDHNMMSVVVEGAGEREQELQIARSVAEHVLTAL